MTCPNHVTAQTWCRQCFSGFIGNPLLRETAVGDMPAPLITSEATSRHDAAAARIAGLEASVNEKLARIAALESEVASLRSTESEQLGEARTGALLAHIRGLLAILRQHGGYTTPEQQQIMRDARAEVAT